MNEKKKILPFADTKTGAAGVKSKVGTETENAPVACNDYGN